MTLYELTTAALRILGYVCALAGREESNRVALPPSVPHNELEPRPACMCCICEEKASQVKCERINALFI